MEFCKACGNIMPFGGMKCPRCGYSKDGAGDNATGGPAPFFNADKHRLVMDLQKFRDLLSETEELKEMIKPQSSFPTQEESVSKKKSFMAFFWPFMVAAIVGGYGIYMIATFIAMQSVYTATNYKTDIAYSHFMSDTFGGIVVALVVAAIIIFFGVKVGKRKQADYNNNVDMLNRIASEKYQQGLQNQRMINLYQENINSMRKYETLVPEEYQTSEKLTQIIDLLKDDKADTVEEAIALL